MREMVLDVIRLPQWKHHDLKKQLKHKNISLPRKICLNLMGTVFFYTF